ncbi:MAG: inorganic diphosphatase [Patescibacteria group bacterium]
MENEAKQVAVATDYLGKTVTITIDRPINSKHPKFGWPYPLNYGFVPGTLSPDGEELDAYLIGINEPVESYAGVCIAVIHRTNDNDDKLVVVTEDKKSITDDELREATHFQEQYFTSEILR